MSAVEISCISVTCFYIAFLIWQNFTLQKSLGKEREAYAEERKQLLNRIMAKNIQEFTSIESAEKVPIEPMAVPTDAEEAVMELQRNLSSMTQPRHGT